MFAKRTDPRPKTEQGDEGSSREGLGVAPAYGIADAIRLMRSLPSDQNMDLVVGVVRVTLNSVDVRLDDIIADATRRQKAIEDNIAVLREHVTELKEQLEARKRDIAAQEADLKETTAVKERLYLAERSTGHPRPAAAVAGNGPGAVAASSASRAAANARVRLPKPVPRDESGEIPDIIAELDLETEPPPMPGRR